MSLSLAIVTGSMSRNAGGLFNSVRKSALSLAEAGIDLSVYALRDEYSASDIEEWKPLTPQILPAKFEGIFPYAPNLAAKLNSGKHDILHLHGIWQLQSSAVLRWKDKTGRPTMISPRGMLDPWALSHSGWKKRIVAAWFENRNLREANCLHALNESEAAAMRAYGLKNPIARIPNATDLPDVPERRQRDGRKTALFLGRIHPKKGLNPLVDAWALASRRRSELAREWQLVIAGWDDGGHLDALRKQIDELRIGDSISIFGPAFGAKKDRLLRDADAFILPSFSEGLPMSVLEAWSYRLPVLMTAECNLPEGFIEGAAIKIEAEPEALAASLLESLLECDLIPLGERGRSMVKDQFSWQEIAKQHIAVYNWLCRDGVRPACVDVVGG